MKNGMQIDGKLYNRGAVVDHRRDCSRSRAAAGSRWTKPELEREIKDRMAHFYGQTDGSMSFPNTAEGDLLKLVYRLLSENSEVCNEGEQLGVPASRALRVPALVSNLYRIWSAQM